LLYGLGVESGKKNDAGDPVRIGFNREEALAEMAEGTRIPLWKALRCRIRYMTDGGAFGTDEFVDDYFKDQQERFGDGRKKFIRRQRADWCYSEQ